MAGRKKANLSAKVERNLLSYATAATAAGVGMLALVEPATARVIYTPAHVRINSHRYHLDLNQDEIHDFTLKNIEYRTYSGRPIWELKENALHGNAVLGSNPYGLMYPSALSKGATIGSGGAFYAGFGVLAGCFAGGDSSGTFGKWINVEKRYLGLRFRINAGVHYGWARLNVHVMDFNITATLTGYAYETIPNKAIIAGDRGSTNGAATGAPTGAATLGSLAMGAAGRKQHSQSLVADRGPVLVCSVR